MHETLAAEMTRTRLSRADTTRTLASAFPTRRRRCGIAVALRRKRLASPEMYTVRVICVFVRKRGRSANCLSIEIINNRRVITTRRIREEVLKNVRFNSMLLTFPRRFPSIFLSIIILNLNTSPSLNIADFFLFYLFIYLFIYLFFSNLNSTVNVCGASRNAARHQTIPAR